MDTRICVSLILTFCAVTVCGQGGCDKTYTRNSGVITSPTNSSTGMYPNNASCTYTIIGSQTQNIIELTFERFETETNYDRLHIKNESFSGIIFSRTIRTYSFNNSISLLFTTDDDSTRPGFTINYKVRGCPQGYYGTGCAQKCSDRCQLELCDPLDGTCTPPCRSNLGGDNCTYKRCDKTYTRESGVISSPTNSSTGNYPNNAWCTYTIIGGRYNNIIELTFRHFNIHSEKDRLYIKKEYFTGTISGGTKRTYSFNNSITLVFTTDATRIGPGFTINYKVRGCPLGYYGTGCAQECTQGCQLWQCDSLNGMCTPPCISGWGGYNCLRKCNWGTYGEDCALVCSEGCANRSCDPESGTCEQCGPGWEHGDPSGRCDKKCSKGFYGKACRSNCSEECMLGTCNPLDGTCEPPCIEDLTDNNCKIKNIYCQVEEYNTTVGLFRTSRTPVGETFSTPEQCHVDKQPMGEVLCSDDGQGGGIWGNFTTNRACDYSDLNASGISDTLADLIQSGKGVEEVIFTTVNITKNETLNELDVLLITNIMEKTTNLSEVSSQVAEGVLAMYDKVLEAPDSALVDSKARAASPNRILYSVDDITGKIKPGPTGTARVSTETFVSEVWDLTNPNVTNENLPIGLSLSLTVDNQTSGLDSVYNKSVNYSQTEAAILLPRNFLVDLQNDSEGKDIRMSMNVYKDPLLFTKGSTNEDKYRLNSKVVAAKILVSGDEISNLDNDSVTMIFSPTKVDAGEAKTCGYWNFSLSGWSTDGCVHSQGESGQDVCTCDHLTNFAVLLNLDGEAHVHSLPLSVITIIGLSLSILGLSGTLLSFIMFKKLREKHPQQTLFNLALAELCSWLVFLAGITQTQSHPGCTLVAILLHYFLLASFLWMLAEAFLHYLLLVKAQAQGTFTTRYMLKTGVPAWGLPLLPVLIVLAVDPGLYRGSDSHCWMSVTASLYAFALPVGVVILFNIIIYIMVVVSIFKISKGRAQGPKGNRKRELLKIRVPALCFILFGLSWIFGYMAVFDAKVVFQYLFCLTSSTQGFLIFIFFTARNEEVRQLWSRLCCKKRHERVKPIGRKDLSTSNVATKSSDDIAETTTSV